MAALRVYVASLMFYFVLRVSRVPQLTDVSEKSDDVRPVSSPGLLL